MLSARALNKFQCGCNQKAKLSLKVSRWEFVSSLLNAKTPLKCAYLEAPVYAGLKSWMLAEWQLRLDSLRTFVFVCEKAAGSWSRQITLGTISAGWRLNAVIEVDFVRKDLSQLCWICGGKLKKNKTSLFINCFPLLRSPNNLCVCFQMQLY